MKGPIAVLIVTALVILQSCKSSGKPGAGESPVIVAGPAGEAIMVTIRAWVDAIDKSNRTVTLKGPLGGTVTLDVKDPSKLDAMAVGDPVVAAYLEALALALKKVSGPSVNAAQDASAPQETPSATLGREVIVTATIAAVDQGARTVTITTARGNIETIKVRDPASLEGVEPGDLAELTYIRALAITIDRAGL